MDVRALIVEQLEADGSLRTFRMVPGRHLVTVAFPEEYQNQRSGPFHFLNREEERRFGEGFATAQARRVGADRFKVSKGRYMFRTSWQGIPTEHNYLTYYALSLPEQAVPDEIRAYDPHSGHEYKKHVTRDDDRKRFVIYIDCRSSRGMFDFVLETAFRLAPADFPGSTYKDTKTDDYGRQVDQYTWYLKQKEARKVQQFFADRIQVGNNYDQVNTRLSVDQSTHINAPITNTAFAAHSEHVDQTVSIDSALAEILTQLLDSAERNPAVSKSEYLGIVREVKALKQELAKPKPARSVVERILGSLGSIASITSFVDRIAPFLPALF
ncbi:MAG: hypothetical protein ACYSYV_05560 [Planctomycetota bacterium]|jgi:hypothetical protein